MINKITFQLEIEIILEPLDQNKCLNILTLPTILQGDPYSPSLSQRAPLCHRGEQQSPQTVYKRVHYIEQDPLEVVVALAIFPCLFIPQSIVEPLLLEAKYISRQSLYQRSGGAAPADIRNSCAGADWQSQNFIPVVHRHEQLFCSLGSSSRRVGVAVQESLGTPGLNKQTDQVRAMDMVCQTHLGLVAR